MKFANRKVLVLTVLSVILISIVVVFLMATESNSGVVEEEAKYKLSVSEWVKEGLHEYMKTINVSKKIKVIPYGSSISYISSNKPIKGRILWVGKPLELNWLILRSR